MCHLSSSCQILCSTFSYLDLFTIIKIKDVVINLWNNTIIHSAIIKHIKQKKNFNLRKHFFKTWKYTIRSYNDTSTYPQRVKLVHFFKVKFFFVRNYRLILEWSLPLAREFHEAHNDTSCGLPSTILGWPCLHNSFISPQRASQEVTC